MPSDTMWNADAVNALTLTGKPDANRAPRSTKPETSVACG
jgi:hypothetical protein